MDLSVLFSMLDLISFQKIGPSLIYHIHIENGFHFFFQIKAMNSQVSPSSNEEGCSCDDGNSSTSPLELTLENFDSDQVPDDCPFVLTSPRSLEACKLVGVRVSKYYSGTECFASKKQFKQKLANDSDRLGSTRVEYDLLDYFDWI